MLPKNQTHKHENRLETKGGKQPKVATGATIFSPCRHKSGLKCQVRCTGTLPYHTGPHHLRWRWFSSLRSGRVSPWSCYRADRSGPACGSGRPGSSCGSRCKHWNQQGAAGTPEQRCKQGGKERWNTGRETDRGLERFPWRRCLVVMCAFMGAVSKRLHLRGSKPKPGTCGSAIVLFIILLWTGMFYAHRIYKLITVLQDVLMKSLFE